MAVANKRKQATRRYYYGSGSALIQKAHVDGSFMYSSYYPSNDEKRKLKCMYVVKSIYMFVEHPPMYQFFLWKGSVIPGLSHQERARLERDRIRPPSFSQYVVMARIIFPRVVVHASYVDTVHSVHTKLIHIHASCEDASYILFLNGEYQHCHIALVNLSEACNLAVAITGLLGYEPCLVPYYCRIWKRTYILHRNVRHIIRQWIRYHYLFCLLCHFLTAAFFHNI